MHITRDVRPLSLIDTQTHTPSGVSITEAWKAHMSNFITVFGLPYNWLFEHTFENSKELFPTVDNGTIPVTFGQEKWYFDIKVFDTLNFYRRAMNRDYNPDVVDPALVNMCDRPIKICARNERLTEFKLLTISHKFAMVMLEKYNEFLVDYINTVNMVQDRIFSITPSDDQSVHNTLYMDLVRNTDRLECGGYFRPE